MSTQSGPETETAAHVEPEKTAARWEDYVDIFFTPASVFRRRRFGGLVHPMVTLAIVSVALYFIMLPAQRDSAAASASPQTAELMEQWGLLFQVLGGLFVPITWLVIVTVIGTVLWLAASVVSVKVGFKDTLLIVTYAAFVGQLSMVLGGILTLVGAGAGDAVADMSFGPLRFIDREQLSFLQLWPLAALDLFFIWQAILWGVGLRVIGNATRGQAMIATGITWLVSALPGAFFSSLRQPTTPPTALL